SGYHSAYEGNQEKHQEHEEQDLCDPCRSAGDAAITEGGCDERDHKEDKRVVEQRFPPIRAVEGTVLYLQLQWPSRGFSILGSLLREQTPATALTAASHRLQATLLQRR